MVDLLGGDYPIRASGEHWSLSWNVKKRVLEDIGASLKVCVQFDDLLCKKIMIPSELLFWSRNVNGLLSRIRSRSFHRLEREAWCLLIAKSFLKREVVSDLSSFVKLIIFDSLYLIKQGNGWLHRILFILFILVKSVMMMFFWRLRIYLRHWFRFDIELLDLLSVCVLARSFALFISLWNFFSERYRYVEAIYGDLALVAATRIRLLHFVEQLLLLVNLIYQVLYAL